MPFTLSLVTNPSDFHTLCPMAHDAWQTPYNPQLKHFVRPLPTRAEAIEDMIARYQQRLAEHPHDRWWIKVVDSETGEPVGLAYWSLEKGRRVGGDGQEEEEEKTTAFWYPEGSVERRFAERFIDGLHRFIAERVPRPHLGTSPYPTLHFPLLMSIRSALLRRVPVTPSSRCGPHVAALGHRQGGCAGCRDDGELASIGESDV
jgi:hypothetical protein